MPAAAARRGNQTIYDQENFWTIFGCLLIYFCLSSFSEYLYQSQYTFVWVTAHLVYVVKYLFKFVAAESCREHFFGGYPPGRTPNMCLLFFIVLVYFCLSCFYEYLFKSQYTIVWVTGQFVRLFKWLWMISACYCREHFFVIFWVFVYDGW